MRAVALTLLLAMLFSLGLGSWLAAGGFLGRPLSADRPSRAGEESADGPSAAELRRAYSLPSAQWPVAWIDPGVVAPELKALSPPLFPTGHAWTAAKEQLGRLLFFDPRLSASGQIACASCHDPQFGWADGKRRAIGFGRSEGQLNTPSAANSGYQAALFWDGRAASLEGQIAGSLTNPIEMNTSVHRATAQIAAVREYRPLVAAAYGDSRVDWARLCDAIATFVRTITVRDTPYDRFLQGDSNALSDSAVRGLHLFRTRARCMNCHSGELLSDGRYHHLGTSFYEVENYQGRYAVTHDPADMGRFRTPGLRGVMHTGPWMHNGLVNDMDDLLSLYNSGWWQNARPHAGIDDALFPRLDPLIRPLGLSRQELADLRQLLKSMSPMPSYEPVPDLPGRPSQLQANLR